MIHRLADCLNDKVPESTNIWQYTVVLEGAIIGQNCNICSHCFIENDVCIGDNVTIKNGVQLWDGIQIGNNVQIGPNVTFTNDKYPRAKQPFILKKILIKDGASIGANSTILGGVTIGENALIGAGSVVTVNVPPEELWFGVPAKFIRKL